MKQIKISRSNIVYIVSLIVLLLGVSTVQAQQNTSRYEVRPGEPISATLETLEIIYVLEASIDKTEETLALKLSVYPNPTTSQLHINIEEQGAIKQLFFYTVTGSRVHAPQLRSTAYSSTHDVARLPNGIYLVVVELENGKRITKKIIKN